MGCCTDGSFPVGLGKRNKMFFLACVLREISFPRTANSGNYDLLLTAVPPYKSGGRITEAETLPGLTLTLQERRNREQKLRAKKGK